MLFRAPRIVGVQNALTYVLISKATFNYGLVSAFSEAYGSIFPLSSAEASLARVVMLDRIWLVVGLLARIRRERSIRRERLAIRLINLVAWLADHGDRLTDDMMTHAKR